MFPERDDVSGFPPLVEVVGYGMVEVLGPSVEEVEESSDIVLDVLSVIESVSEVSEENEIDSERVVETEEAPRLELDSGYSSDVDERLAVSLMEVLTVLLSDEMVVAVEVESLMPASDEEEVAESDVPVVSVTDDALPDVKSEVELLGSPVVIVLWEIVG